MPRFTIVVPTRNRPRELSLTLDTLRQLHGTDLSIVVSDNSEAEFVDENRRNVEAALAGTPFTYVRPDRSLNMVDHWNFALDHADGDYVGIVTDRLTLVPAAIDIIDRVIRESGVECVCWSATIFDVRNSDILKPHGPRVEAEVMSSREILQRFAASEMLWISPPLPQLLLLAAGAGGDQGAPRPALRRHCPRLLLQFPAAQHDRPLCLH